MAQFFSTNSYLKEVICIGSNQAGIDHSNTIIAELIDDPANLVKLAKYDGLKPFSGMSGSQQVLNRSQAGSRLTQILGI